MRFFCKCAWIMTGLYLLSIGNATAAVDSDSLKQAILTALTDGANYAADVLLDEKGKSRCDYNWLQGKWYDYEPAWHTGQIIYGLVEAYRVTGNPKYLETAKKAGDWWVSLEIKDHPKLKGMLRAVHGDYIGDYIVFATISDGANGIFNLYEATGDKKYADVATRAGQWMLDHMWVPEQGVFYDVVDAKTGEVYKDRSPFWPDKKQELFDVARPNNEGSLFKYMYDYTRKQEYKDVFVQVCESLVQKQGPEGLWMDFMPNSKEEGSFHPRFNLWYAESLIDGYELTGERKYLEAARKTAEMYAKVQQDDGTIYYKNYLSGKKNRNSVSGSTVAFAGIVWLRLLQHGVGDAFKENIERSLNWTLINRYAPDHPDPNLAGGFIEFRTRRKQGRLWITHRDVGTSFALRFLANYYQYAFGEN